MKNNNVWYAAQKDNTDDWSTGSFDLDEAKAIARGYREDGNADALVAVIENDTCIDEIYDLD